RVCMCGNRKRCAPLGADLVKSKCSLKLGAPSSLPL
ncbi:hypothetical protein NPIL_33811, partial [Nephila pilipes]